MDMSSSTKPLPTLPAFNPPQQLQTKAENPGTPHQELDAFVYCSDYGKENYDQYRQAYKLKTDYKYGNINDEYDLEFQRKDVKDAIHIITSEIKAKGAKSPFFLLPFRPQQHDIKLKEFLNKIFVKGAIAPNEKIEEAAFHADEYTLASALKFFWCRLPGNCIIGWGTYTKFVALEEESEFPETAFLDFMPSCLSSGAHASITYDFFDLLVTIAINSKENLLSGKKISKMCGLWAFHANRNQQSGLPSFERGMYEWIPAADAMFHLLLAFLRAMPPKGKSNKMPKVIQTFLKSSTYPPPASTISSSKYLQEVPMVTLRANHPSKSPAELIARVGKTLNFEDPTVFYTREDYLLLKRLFKDVTGLIPKLSSEGSRLLDSMCMYDEDMVSNGTHGNQLKFKLVSGWSTDMIADRDAKSRPGDFFTATVSRASIDDYFIWTWLASLGVEETSVKKKTFGKTYILEVELAEGFKKWVIIEEQDITRDGYDIEIEIKQEKLRELEQKISEAEIEAAKLQRAASARMITESKGLKYTGQERIYENELSERLRNVDLPNPPVPSKDYDRSASSPKMMSPPRQQYQQTNTFKEYYPSSSTPSPQPLPKDQSYKDNLPTPKKLTSEFTSNSRVDPYSEQHTRENGSGSKHDKLDSSYSYQSPSLSPEKGKVPLGISNYSNSQAYPGSFPLSSNRRPSGEKYSKANHKAQANVTPLPPPKDYEPVIENPVKRSPPSKTQAPATIVEEPQTENSVSAPGSPLKSNKRTSKILESFDNLEEELLDYLGDSKVTAQTPPRATNLNVTPQRRKAPPTSGDLSGGSHHSQKSYSSSSGSNFSANSRHIKSPRMNPLNPNSIPSMVSPSPKQNFYPPEQSSPGPYQQQQQQQQQQRLPYRDQSPQALPQSYPGRQSPQQQQQRFRSPGPAQGMSGRSPSPSPNYQNQRAQQPQESPSARQQPPPQQRGRSMDVQPPMAAWSPNLKMQQRPSSQSPSRGKPVSMNGGPSPGGYPPYPPYPQAQGYPPYPPYPQYPQYPPPPQGGAPGMQPYYGYPPVPYGYPPQPYGYPPPGQQPHGPKSYSDLALNQMPAGAKNSKLHGHQQANKAKARNALMKGDFGI